MSWAGCEPEDSDEETASEFACTAAALAKLQKHEDHIQQEGDLAGAQPTLCSRAMTVRVPFTCNPLNLSRRFALPAFANRMVSVYLWVNANIFVYGRGGEEVYDYMYTRVR